MYLNRLFFCLRLTSWRTFLFSGIPNDNCMMPVSSSCLAATYWENNVIFFKMSTLSLNHLDRNSIRLSSSSCELHSSSAVVQEDDAYASSVPTANCCAVIRPSVHGSINRHIHSQNGATDAAQQARVAMSGNLLSVLTIEVPFGWKRHVLNGIVTYFR